MKLVEANTDSLLLEHVKWMWQEYANSLDFKLDSLLMDLQTFPAPYEPPTGGLILAQIEGQTVGCVAFKRETKQTSKMIRLFVLPAFRRKGVAKLLVTQVIKKSRQLGYLQLTLELVPTKMRESLKLYQALGFQKIDSYYDARIPAQVDLMMYEHLVT